MIFVIFSLLGFALFSAAIIALIKPTWVKAPKSSRILGFLTYFVASMVATTIGSQFMTDEQKAESAKNLADYETKKTAGKAEQQKAYEASELKNSNDELTKTKSELAKANSQIAKKETEQTKPDTVKPEADKPTQDLQTELRKKIEEMKAEGIWEVQEDVSKVDDSKNVWIVARSNQPVIGRYNRKGWGKLVLRCMENKTDVLITFDQYLSTQDLNVITRLDKEKATSRTWSITTDHEGLLHPSAVDFIRQLEKSKALYAQFTPYASDPVDMDFNVQALEKSVGKLKEACHWN